MRRTLLPALAALGLALTVAACSNSPSPSASGRSTTTTAPAPSGGSTGSASGGSIPSVTNGTDLNVAPTVAAGTGPAPTTLETKDLVVGTGATAKAGDTVVVQYVGALYANGHTFDSSWSRGQAATFSLSGVIPGFAQGIEGMKVGGRRVIVIPPALAYGADPPAGSGIPANAPLVFVVDLKALNPAASSSPST